MRSLPQALACHHLTIGIIQPGQAQTREVGPYCAFNGAMIREAPVTCRLCPSHNAPKPTK